MFWSICNVSCVSMKNVRICERLILRIRVFKVIGFDMGGTSTDVSRYDGHHKQVLEMETAGMNIQAPQLDIDTEVAGGGSKLFFQDGVFKVISRRRLFETVVNRFSRAFADLWTVAAEEAVLLSDMCSRRLLWKRVMLIPRVLNCFEKHDSSPQLDEGTLGHCPDLQVRNSRTK